MKSFLLRLYDKAVLERPALSLLIALAVMGFFVAQIPKFKLDASADSLVLENDASLRYYRKIAERYAESDFLVLTYSPREDLFSDASLAGLARLRDDLGRIERVTSVTTILDVPLFFSSGISLGDLAEEGKIKTLEQEGVDREKAREEFTESPLYRKRLLSPDGQTTAVLVNMPVDHAGRDLLKRRYELREKRYDGVITSAEEARLREVEAGYRRHLTEATVTQRRLVEDIRAVMDRHRGGADLYLGGVPMIITDMISFIRNDLVVFGLGVFFFLVITLAVIFRKPRWVVLSLLCCLAAGLTIIGYLGLVDWRVTVISSNFISLMLIFTMSLTIHLIVRYRELHAEGPERGHRELVLETVRLKVLPCLYTTLTTIVAFISLLVSDIRPVMDFGVMMTVGLAVSFMLSFVLFPAGLLLLKKDEPGAGGKSSPPFTLVFARLTEAHGGKILLVSLLLALVSGLGISRLKVENRFIDYFRESTEIYQGMKMIDQKLGGTTPLDVIIDFVEEEDVPAEETATGEPFEEDLFADLEDEESESEWFISSYKMEQIVKVHDYLDGLPETGGVLSIATAIKTAVGLNEGVDLDNFELALLHQKTPEGIKKILIDPYLSEDEPQARITLRVMESDKNLERAVLLKKIRQFLTGTMGFDDGQVNFTSMFVLYNNMLQSLFRSQILTIGMVFISIMAMFMVLFRSLFLAVIAIIPNLLPAAMVLGAMGWSGIPLDMMTITLAAITIGIAVDDTIHYIHRFVKEFAKDRNYLAAVHRCHGSIGRAMYYTSLTIIIGFSILVLSNFKPTVYFGIFTGFGMLVALVAALTLLPQLLIVLKPLGPEGSGSFSDEKEDVNPS